MSHAERESAPLRVRVCGYYPPHNHISTLLGGVHANSGLVPGNCYSAALRRFPGWPHDRNIRAPRVYVL